MSDARPPFTNLQLVEQVDAWPYFSKDPDAYRRHMLDYHYFFVEGYDKPFGYVHNGFVGEVDWPEYWKIDQGKRYLTMTTGTDFASRSRLMNETLRKGSKSQMVSALMHWADEEFPLHSSCGEHVLNLDGCGVDPFGIVNYSVHMTGWVMTSEGIKIWVPRRSFTKSSFPGMLDNTVGGSLAAGETPLDGMIRECQEEICLDPVYTRANIRSCGTCSFQLAITDLLKPGCQHQVQYVYEMELRQDIVPRIGDGEVCELSLMTLDEVRQAMRNGEFKPACNMTYLAFLIRHGHINHENEPDLVEICSRLHRHHALFID